MLYHSDKSEIIDGILKDAVNEKKKDLFVAEEDNMDIIAEHLVNPKITD